jgi:hypothetical protein
MCVINLSGPAANANIRRLKQGEIELLEEALGEEADREYLVFWVSQSIANHVKLSPRPKLASLLDGAGKIPCADQIKVFRLVLDRVGSCRCRRTGRRRLHR